VAHIPEFWPHVVSPCSERRRGKKFRLRKFRKFDDFGSNRCCAYQSIRTIFRANQSLLSRPRVRPSSPWRGIRGGENSTVDVTLQKVLWSTPYYVLGRRSRCSCRDSNSYAQIGSPSLFHSLKSGSNLASNDANVTRLHFPVKGHLASARVVLTLN
jgi:hypothetical protein